MSKRTTKAHFAVFKAEAEYWIDRLGLKDWSLTIIHGKGNYEGLAFATYYADFESKDAQIHLRPKWPIPISEYELRKSAFHEVAHVLIYPVQAIYLGTLRDGPERTHQDSLSHGLVQQLTNGVWQQDYERRLKKGGKP